jgi:hypothetical protein
MLSVPENLFESSIKSGMRDGDYRWHLIQAQA